MDTFSVRILVVGDSGVGKTTLLETLCRTEPHSSKEKPVSPRGSSRTPRQNITPHSQWTTGCDLHVLLYRYRETYGSEREVYIEFIDVGGHPRYEISRQVFYHNVQGIIFVHDLGNIRSYNNLKRWLSEISHKQRTKGFVLDDAGGGDISSLNALPKLVIGGKKDTISNNTKLPNSQTDLRIEGIEVSVHNFSVDLPGVYTFFDRVISEAISNSQKRKETSHDFTNNSNNTFGSEGLRQVKNTSATSWW